jgi:hypothetical protein
VLKDLGEYRELNMEDIFGYDKESDLQAIKE